MIRNKLGYVDHDDNLDSEQIQRKQKKGVRIGVRIVLIFFASIGPIVM